jgi:DHA1 family bicyclomycin/chloramphenicol resistance-like MFS transporter
MSRTPPSDLTFMVTAVTALGPVTMSMYAPSMPAIARAFGASDGAVQLTLSLYLAGFAVAQLVYGPLSDRFGRRNVLLVGLAVYLAGTIACALAPSIGMLVAARVVQAMGACAGPALGRAMVRDVYPRDQAAQVLALVGMALAVAPAIAPALGGYLQVWYDWHAIFVVLGAFGLALLVFMAARLPETNPAPDPDALQPARIREAYAQLIGSRTYVGYMAVGAIALGGLFTFYATSPFSFIDKIGLTPDQYGWTNMGTVGGFLLGSVAANRIVIRLGIDRMIALSGAVSGTGAALMILFGALGWASVATVIGPMALWTLGLGMALPTSMAGAMAPFPRIAGSASALMGFMQMGSGMAGSMTLSALPGATALALGLALLALWATGYGLFFSLIGPGRKTAPAANREAP